MVVIGNEGASTVRELDDGSFVITGGTGTYGSKEMGISIYYESIARVR